MKKIMKFVLLLMVSVSLNGCIQETFIQQGYASAEQVANTPDAYESLVGAITSTLVGDFYFGSSYPYDHGYPSFFLQRDVMGQDIVCEDSSTEWYTTWYQVGTGLGPQYLTCQIPWTYYYSWINNCNTIIGMAGDDPDETQISGAGIAYAMRAMFYMDLARMYQYTYVGHEQDETVPIVTESTTPDEATNNPRATNEAIWAFILSDLDKAEEYLASYTRTSKETPDLSVVYGFKARAYLTMENFEQAEYYANLAQQGYTAMSSSEYLDRDTGFNTPNNSWMLYVQYEQSDPNITENDADSSWASWMVLESTSGCGYASNYGAPKRIDYYLYSTIPDTDFRKKCFVNFELDEISDQSVLLDSLSNYSDYPNQMITTAQAVTGHEVVGGLCVKFRSTGGAEGHSNQYIGFSVGVPLMRVEEMMLIEAEAAGMQDESRGRQLLETFALTRDPNYQYDSNLTFRDNVWWQRRVELWGEGFATFDIKRLNKGITRSYTNTNHPTGYRYNTDEVPYWMNLCIVQTETNYNFACTNNPTPVAPGGDSDPAW